MVDYRGRAKRLTAFKQATGLGFAGFGELAGRSAQAMQKACKTGRIDEVTADKLVSSLKQTFPKLKADLAELMYGAPTQRIASEADLDRATALQVLSNLPPQHRDTWIDIGHIMVQRYGAQGAGKPFVVAKDRLTKRKAVT